MTASAVAPRALSYQPGEPFARALDAADPLAAFRDRFQHPVGPDGRPLVYLTGNSLGLMPKTVPDRMQQELRDWGTLAVEAHMKAKTPWYNYHEVLRDPLARLVGALPDEVVAMNSLTINLHLMLVTFYQPTATRYKVLVEDAAFPSDSYAIASHLRLRGIDPAQALIIVRPRAGEHTLRTEDVLAQIQKQGAEIALVLLGGVHYYSGLLHDMARITTAGHAAGCKVGFDLAHAAGNAKLSLHDWNVDFAVWCCYKYLNGGPGAVGGCFVHQRFGNDRALPRLAGWWGNDPATRFRLHLNAEFVPQPGADGWQISNPPIFSMTPLHAALEIFDEAGIDALRAKSVRLTGYLEYLLDGIQGGGMTIITPRDPAARGCQLSLLIPKRAQEIHEGITAQGIVADFRQPDVIRMAPAPLFNSYHDVWRAAEVLRGQMGRL